MTVVIGAKEYPENILENLKKIEDRFEIVRALFAEGPALALRCKGIGYMSKKEAREYMRALEAERKAKEAEKKRKNS